MIYSWNGYAWDLVTQGNVPLSVLLSTVVASNQATVDFISLLTSTYDEYEVHFFDVTASAASNNLNLRIGEGGVIQTASNYRSALNMTNDIAANSPFGATTSAAIPLLYSGQLGSGAANAVSGRVEISRAATTGTYKNIIFRTAYTIAAGNLNVNYGAGTWTADTNPIDSLRFLMATGNIVTGTFKLYGVR